MMTFIKSIEEEAAYTNRIQDSFDDMLVSTYIHDMWVPEEYRYDMDVIRQTAHRLPIMNPILYDQCPWVLQRVKEAILQVWPVVYGPDEAPPF